MKHKAVFMGRVERKTYEVAKFESFRQYVDSEPFIYEIETLAYHVTIDSVELENPPLKRGDEIFIVKLNDCYKVEKIVRSTDNSYIYYVDYIQDVIEDEETEKSRIEAEKSCAKEIELRKKEKEKIKERLQGLEDKNKKWYEFWK